VGRKSGLSEKKLMAVPHYESSPDLTSLEKLVVRYAAAMTATPVEIPDDLFEELKSHLNERQLVELTSAIAWENYRARYNHAFGIGSEGFSEGAFCALPEHGTSGVREAG